MRKTERGEQENSVIYVIFDIFCIQNHYGIIMISSGVWCFHKYVSRKGQTKGPMKGACGISCGTFWFLSITDLASCSNVPKKTTLFVLSKQVAAELKGLVHPKMKIMSFITHPHVVLHL